MQLKQYALISNPLRQAGGGELQEASGRGLRGQDSGVREALFPEVLDLKAWEGCKVGFYTGSSKCVNSTPTPTRGGRLCPLLPSPLDPIIRLGQRKPRFLLKSEHKGLKNPALERT